MPGMTGAPDLICMSSLTCLPNVRTVDPKVVPPCREASAAAPVERLLDWDWDWEAEEGFEELLEFSTRFSITI